jgi:hypothetical protein
MEPDTDSYYDKDTGQLRNLLWSDIDADRSAEKSKPRATQPLVLRFFGSMREIKSAGEETVDKVKGIRAAGVLVCDKFNLGCGFAITVRYIRGTHKTGGTFKYSAHQVGDKTHANEWVLNLTHHCGCDQQ